MNEKTKLCIYSDNDDPRALGCLITLADDNKALGKMKLVATISSSRIREIKERVEAIFSLQPCALDEECFLDNESAASATHWIAAELLGDCKTPLCLEVLSADSES